MRSEDILKFTRKRPFEPFRVTLTDGRVYDVVHPDMAMVGRSAMVIGFPRKGEQDPIFERSIDVSLLHIMQIERIQPATTGGNGSPE